MNDTATLITEVFDRDNQNSEYNDAKDWLTNLLKTENSELLNDLIKDPLNVDTQKKLKSFIAQLSDNESVRVGLIEKMSSLNKTIEQRIVNENTIDKQINIAHHSGNIIINNYATQKEKQEESAAKFFDIKMLIASGDTKQAIEKLLQVSKIIGDPDILNRVISLAGRFNRNEKEILDGTVSKDESKTERVNLVNAALRYLDDLERLNSKK